MTTIEKPLGRPDVENQSNNWAKINNLILMVKPKGSLIINFFQQNSSGRTQMQRQKCMTDANDRVNLLFEISVFKLELMWIVN